MSTTIGSRVVVTWEHARELAHRLIPGVPPGARTVYGVPRGGWPVALLLREQMVGRLDLVGSATAADVIVDDVRDSGRTEARYAGLGKPFLTLVDKREEPWRNRWVVFPWEADDAERDLEDHAARLLEGLGADLNADGLKDTPARMVRALRDLTTGYQIEPKLLLERVFEESYDELVIVRRVPFWSLCEHHVLPFHGHATVGYLPNQATGKVVGLSKLARVVEARARRLQVQERLTREIAADVEAALKPRAVGVVVEAVHLCMAARGAGVEAPMVTSVMLGALRENAAARAEFLALARPEA